MSSLAHDRLLNEGPEPRTRAGSPLAAKSGTRTRRVSVPAAEKVPAPRQARGGATGRVAAAATKQTVSKAAKTAATATRTAGAKAAATTRAAAKTAATTSPAVKTVVTKAAATKTAVTEAAAAKTTAAKTTTAAKPAAKAATPKPATPKPATAKPATAKPATTQAAATSAPARRPRPTPRPRPAAPVEAAPEILLPAEGEPVLEVPAVVADPEPSAPTGRRRLLSSIPRRRRALVLAGALVVALGVGTVSAGAVAQAGPAKASSHSMSVAAELGIRPQKNVTAPDSRDADRLAEVAASRATREAEQAAAVQAQQQADAAAVEAMRPQAVLPVNGARLTTCFCMRWGTMHWGIDLAAPMGTPEYAAMDGVVLEAGPASGFGLAVYIQHANGDVTVYGHMEQILVTAGQVVKAGDTIALLGMNGQSTGPHLHFEVHQGGINGQKVDPIPWLQARGVQVPSA